MRNVMVIFIKIYILHIAIVHAINNLVFQRVKFIILWGFNILALFHILLQYIWMLCRNNAFILTIGSHLNPQLPNILHWVIAFILGIVHSIILLKLSSWSGTYKILDFVFLKWSQNNILFDTFWWCLRFYTSLICCERL